MAHGKTLTIDDQRANAQRLLMDDEWTNMSDHSIAKEVGLAPRSIGRYRSELEQGGKLEREFVIASDGRKIPQLWKKENQSKKTAQSGTVTLSQSAEDMPDLSEDVTEHEPVETPKTTPQKAVSTQHEQTVSDDDPRTSESTSSDPPSATPKEKLESIIKKLSELEAEFKAIAEQLPDLKKLRRSHKESLRWPAEQAYDAAGSVWWAVDEEICPQKKRS
jgi:hypothetical protein